MTVSDYFNVHRIFDRRRIDKLRKVRRSRSTSQEAAPRPSTASNSDIPDELEPVKGTPSSTASATPSTAASSGDGASAGLANDSNELAAAAELPRQPPASSSATPSPAISSSAAPRPDHSSVPHPEDAREFRSGTPPLDTEVPDDVPCEGTFATRSSSDGSIRGRAWSEPAIEDNTFFSGFQCQSASEPTPERVPLPAATDGPMQPSVPSTSPPSSTSCVLCLVGDSLELMMAPGDVLAVKGQGRLTEIGTAHGMLGHVLLVLAPPTNVLRSSDEGFSLQAVWPSAEVEEIWRVRSLESTRSEQGLHEAEMLLYVERSTGQLVLIGELQNDGTLVLTEHEAVELWQSPAELRSQIRVDLMGRVLSEMKTNEASWSHVTVARAILSSARLTSGPGTLPEQTLDVVRACWKREPICTSVVIIFWQRYLCELAACVEENQHKYTLDLILRWMPLKADRGLPGDLLGAMKSVGWVTVAQVPRIFRPMVFTGPSARNAQSFELGGPGRGNGGQRGVAVPDAACEARAMAVAREVATGGA